jgi:hypothetical protein
VFCRPNDEQRLYRIVARRALLGDSVTEAMSEARRLYEVNPWPDRRRRADGVTPPLGNEFGKS